MILLFLKEDYIVLYYNDQYNHTIHSRCVSPEACTIDIEVKLWLNSFKACAIDIGSLKMCVS